MSKKLLALAVAAAVAAPVSATYAASGVYFSLRDQLSIADNGTKTSSKVKNAGSRIGAKMTEDLGNGLKGFARYEIKIDTATSGGVTGGRLGYVGIKGAFGSVSLGQQWGPYYNALGDFDVYNASGAEFYQGPFRLSNSLVYTAPSSDMFSGQIALVMNGYDATVANDQTGVDQVHVGAKFSFGPATLGLGYISDQVNSNNDLVGATLALAFGNATLFFNGESKQQAVGSDIKTYHVVGQFKSGKTRFRAGFSTNDNTNDDAFQLGVEHKLTGTFRVWAEYENQSPNVGPSTSAISLGMRKDWK
ncbi:MAG TPA: porin [Gammaproteobacteria bacterium]|nr:porin [Gammaproteobacteria bacterium]